MSWLSKTIHRNKNTLASVFKAAPIVAAPIVAAVGAGGGFLSSFFGSKNKSANVEGGLSVRGDVLPSPQGSSSITDSLLSGVVSFFRSTPTGQRVEAEATKQAVNDKILTIVKTPWVWIAGIAVIIILFILFRKR